VITDRDIARWRLHSQLLAAPVGGAEEVVWSLLAVQAENPSQSAWAVATRTTSPRQGDLADAIADGRVLRTHVLRPTWHYVHADDAQWLLELTAPRVLPTVDQQLRPLADRMTALTDTVEGILAEASDRTRADLSGALADRRLGDGEVRKAFPRRDAKNGRRARTASFVRREYGRSRGSRRRTPWPIAWRRSRR